MVEQKTTLRKLGDRRKELQHQLQWACFAFQHSKHINRATILFQHAKILELQQQIADIDYAIRLAVNTKQIVQSSLQANTSKR